MNSMAPTRPAVQRPLRLSLPVGPAAAAQARRHVQAAISAWDVPVDPFVAALLTSELVTNAIRYESGESIKVFITCSCGHLRVYVHDSSRAWPLRMEAPPDAESGRGLLLVSRLATEWGTYRTPTGKAVFFTLELSESATGG